MKSTEVVIFFWTLPSDREIARNLDQRFKNYKVCPLRLSAVEASRELFDPDQIISVSDLMQHEDREKISRQALQDLNQFHSILLDYKKEPWLACLQYAITVLWYFYDLRFWQEFIKRLNESYPQARLIHYSFFSRIAFDEFNLLHADLLEAWMQVDQPSTGNHNEGHVGAFISEKVGRFVNKFPTLFMNPCPEATLPDPRPVDQLLCGLQSADSEFQKGLIKTLQEEGVNSYHWMIPEKMRSAISEDETQDLTS